LTNADKKILKEAVELFDAILEKLKDHKTDNRYVRRAIWVAEYLTSQAVNYLNGRLKK
jgi:hypothetical protein